MRAGPVSQAGSGLVGIGDVVSFVVVGGGEDGGVAADVAVVGLEARLDGVLVLGMMGMKDCCWGADEVGVRSSERLYHGEEG